MNNFISIVVAVITFLLLFYAYWIWARGPLHPRPAAEPRKKEAVPTMFDVRRLLKEGDKKGATRLYARIFKVSTTQAQKDIEELERSMKT